MKKARFFLLLLVVSSGSSCSKILNEKPLGVLSPANFFTVESDFEAGVQGAYILMFIDGIYGRWIQEMTVIIDGTLRGQPAWPEVALTFDASWITNSTVWDAHYRVINQCNTILEKLSPVDIPIGKKQLYEGELKFLRALAYFNLVRLYGEVPIHIEATKSLDNVIKPRAAIREVYDVIVQDLQDAEGLLPTTNPNIGRASRGAAVGLLGKVYVTMAGRPLNDHTKLQQAKDQLLELVDPNMPHKSKSPFPFGLEPDYQNLYYVVADQTVNAGAPPVDIIQVPNENGPEGVFEINYTNAGNGIASATYPHAKIRGRLLSPWFLDKGEAGDYRNEVTYVLNAGDPYGRRFQQRKFPRTADAFNNHENNWYYLRYAELVLLLAEVENELNGPTKLAFDCVNAIRTRARNAKGVQRTVPANYELADAPDKETFFELLKRENIIEFSLEGKLWFDWMRWGAIEEYITEQGRNYNPRIELFPIPQMQRSVTQDVLTQNTGY